MSKEHAPQTNTEVPETYIENPALAEEMAYGEKPYLELGRAATELGLNDQVAEMAQKADEAGVEAGRAFIDAKQAELDGMRMNLEVNASSAEAESTFESRVASAKKALAERYGRPEEEFELISFENKDGKMEHQVMYTGLSGIDLGKEKRSFNSLKEDDSHIIEIDGKPVDTRTLTEAGYRAFVQRAIERGDNPLPDSSALAEVDGEGVWSATWLPGEDAGGSDARAGCVYGGQARVRWRLRVPDSADMCVRPAVEIVEN